MGIAEAEQRAASGDLDACDGHNSSSSGNGGGPFFSFTRSPHRLFVRALSDAQETAFEQLRLHLKLVSEGEEELPTDFIRQLGNYSPKLKITLDLISRDPSKYLRSIWFLPLPSKSISKRNKGRYSPIE